jgi:TonB family protein
MKYKNTKYISYLFSISIHALVILFLVISNLSNSADEEEYVLVGYGPGFGNGSPGGGSGSGNQLGEGSLAAEPPSKEEDKEKKVDLPKSDQLPDEDALPSTGKNKKDNDAAYSKVKPLVQGNSKGTGFGYGGEGIGNGTGNGTGSGGGGFGFELDFGGNGKRRIYSYSVPEYPEGVAKEIDLKLRFTIQPDGTVSRIIPLIKADARLELTAINSLRQWRFEPLPRNAKQMEQTVVITFPYRLQ